MATRPRRLTDRAIAKRIVAWFERSARDLPWRTDPRDPYRALVSEAMLQQTQVSRVLEKYQPFLDRFPTAAALAEADEDDVLAAWSGLGYYRRARLLQGAARKIVEDHGGKVPSDVDELRSLPGVGRYTAGAIASIVFDRSAPIVDGNVSRVLLRFEGKDAGAGDPEAVAWSWDRAASLAEAAAKQDSVAIFNEGLMELGATVCLPAGPRCEKCPLKSACVARKEGSQEEIPRARPRAKRKTVHHAVALIESERGEILVEKRPSTGLWAGMWQPPALERDDRPATASELAAWLGAPLPERIGSFTHLTTHRTVEFTVWGAAGPVDPARGRWREPSEVAALALSNPHRRILAMIGAGASG